MTLSVETALATEDVLNHCNRIARNLTQDVDVAQDVSQTALLELWENRKEYQGLFDYATVGFETAFYRMFWIIAKRAADKVKYYRKTRWLKPATQFQS